MLGADLVPPCHLRNNCARGKGFRNDPALLRLGPATPTPNTCPDFYSAARPRSVKYIVDHICEPIPSNRSTSADLSKPPQGAVRRPLTLRRLQEEEYFQCLPRQRRFVSSEPFEYCAIEVGEPLKTEGQLSRSADRCWRPAWGVAAGIVVGLERVVAICRVGRGQNRIGCASKTGR